MMIIEFITFQPISVHQGIYKIKCSEKWENMTIMIKNYIISCWQRSTDLFVNVISYHSLNSTDKTTMYEMPLTFCVWGSGVGVQGGGLEFWSQGRSIYYGGFRRRQLAIGIFARDDYALMTSYGQLSSIKVRHKAIRCVSNQHIMYITGQ